MNTLLKKGTRKFFQTLPASVTRPLPIQMKKKLNLDLDEWEAQISFWDSWFQDEGGIFHEDYKARTNRELRHTVFPTYLNGYLLELERRFPKEQLEVLDVGSGPISVLQWGHDSGKFRLTCVDALAKKYKALLNRYEIDSSSILVPGQGEYLAYDEQFHLAFSRNALDHCASPATVFRNMGKAVKVGGYVVISTAINEGSNMKWTGPHQHNLNLEDGKLTLANRAGEKQVLGNDDLLEPVWSELSPATDVHNGYIDIAFEKVLKY